MLSPAEVARARAVGHACYPYFDEFVCALFTQQLEECRGTWELEDWLSRVATTAYQMEHPETRPVPRAASARIQFG